MTDYKYDPTVLQRGMPAEQRNGLYGGTEARLVELGVGGRFVAVVTFEVADIRASEKEQTHWPVLSMSHIEPLWSADAIADAEKLQKDAQDVRVGANQLNFDDLTPPADDEPSDDEKFEGAAPKGGDK